MPDTDMDAHEFAHSPEAALSGAMLQPCHDDYVSFRARCRQDREQASTGLSIQLPDLNLTGMLDTRKNGDQAPSPSDAQPPAQTEPAGSATDKPPATTDKPPANTDRPPATVNSFAADAKQLFKRIDTDGDGHLNEKELAAALQQPAFTGRDAATLAALYAARDVLSKLSRRPSKGISVDALDRFETMRQASIKPDADNEAIEAARYILLKDKVLKLFDQNGNGRLTLTEIEAGLKQDDLLSFDRKALMYMRDNYRRITNTEGPLDAARGIDLNKFERHIQSEQKARAEHFKDFDTARDTISRTLHRRDAGNAGERRLYSDPEHPRNSIKPDAIKQGSIGNCDFLSTLASLAATNPGAIQKMIKDNGDGTYTVTFPGAPDEPITITTPTEAEQMVYNGASKYGIWASVLEKAYGAYCQKSFWRRGPGNIDGGNTPTEGGDGGSATAHGMRLLIGSDYFSNNLFFASQETVRKNLMEAFSANPPRPVIADILRGRSQTVDGFATSHVYSVIGFDPSGANGGTITIRNPWGVGQGTGGTIQISLEQFMRNFSSVVYSRKTR